MLMLVREYCKFHLGGPGLVSSAVTSHVAVL